MRPGQLAADGKRVARLVAVERLPRDVQRIDLLPGLEVELLPCCRCKDSSSCWTAIVASFGVTRAWEAVPKSGYSFSKP